MDDPARKYDIHVTKDGNPKLAIGNDRLEEP
jgi:hypothetical protein